VILSASSGDSSGSALISMPADPLQLAVTLVHEFQHIKLGGVLHLLTLTADDDRERLYAPWRDDPRPVSGLLQGVYAFLGVTDFWRRRRVAASAGPHRRLADFEFSMWREHTWQALGMLRADAGLTDIGRRFAEGMAARMRPWRDEAVDLEISAMARLAVRDHRVSWRIRHLRPDPGYIAALARALPEGGKASLGQVPESRVVPDILGPWSPQRVTLARMRAQRPGALLTAIDADRGRAWNAAMLPADLALVAGDNERAADAYASLISGDPSQPAAWAGLVLALTACGQWPPSLMRRPEVIVAVYRELAASSQAVPDPRLLVRQLGSSPIT
jgi:hypothetical protein